METLEKLRKDNQFIKVAVYARFSSDHQREESIEAQLRAMKDYTEKNNMVIVAEYIDRAKSATTDNRPEFLRMISDASNEKFEVVLVHKLDRFARNRYDSAHYRHQLKKHGVSIRSVVENLDDSPESIIMESVLEGMAEYYSKNLAREVQKGLKENAYSGKHTGGTPPLGYNINHQTKLLEINEFEADAVKLIYQRTLECYGYSEIIDELNSKGYKTKNGGTFTKNSLNSILQNEKYTGVYVYNKSASKDLYGKRNGHKLKNDDDIIRVEGAVPVIISVEDFQKVQLKLSKRKQNQKSSRAIETYLLRGKMFCGVCGGAYIGSRRIRGDKSVFIAYGCNKRYRNHSVNCKNKEISKPFIEGSVLEKLSEYVFSDKYIPMVTKEYNKFIQSKSNEYSMKLRTFQTLLKKLNNDIESLINLLIQTQSQALMDKLNLLEKEKILLESKIEKLVFENKQTELTENDISIVFAKIREMLMSGDLHNIKRVIDTYISKIVVYPTEVIVQFNFFPSINIELDINEKNRPLDECVEDIQRQFNSCDSNIAVDNGGEGGI